MTTLRARPHSAFTLLEVLIALSIFAIGSLGVLGMMTTTLALNQNSRQSSEATQIGIAQMERLQILQAPMPLGDISSCGTRCWLEPQTAAPFFVQRNTAERAIQPAMLLRNVAATTAGSALWYEVSWRVTTSGPRQFAEVTVYWPKNRDQGATDWSGAGLNCHGGSGRCYSVVFYSYIN